MAALPATRRADFPRFVDRPAPGTAGPLRGHPLAWAGIAEPTFAASVAKDVPTTSDFAYFRFHGRNAKEWWTGDAESRYRYHYDAAEIGELAERLRAAMREVRLMFAYFNNHWQAYAPRNATDLKRTLGLPVKNLQMTLDFPEKTGGAAGV